MSSLVVVVDDDVLRRDVDSDDVRAVFPGVEHMTAAERNERLFKNDMDAYDTIRDEYPDFKPPTATARKDV